ncbi:MAG: methylthioribulose 1-phosphate dehydratase, partial [Planctomycetota bacterium]|nr:methylthioribulose 1-phosphate dehydratase [Planctomycetota bacterium]
TKPSTQDLFFPSDHPLHGHERAVQSLRRCGFDFQKRGWSVGTSSNYSVVASRDPLKLVVTASGKHKEMLAAEDFVVTDEHGQPTVPGQPKSSAETLLHCVVANARPEVGAILHTHSVWSTVLSDYFFEEKGFEIEGFEMLKGLSGISTHETRHWVNIFPNTQDIPILAKQVEAFIQDPEKGLTHGYLIHQHGLYTWGKDIDEARRHIEVYEFLFECLARKMMLKR